MSSRHTFGIAVACFFCVTAPLRGVAQATLSTILTNGPTANRINIVVLSEGYQAIQLARFLVDATNAVNNLLSAPPYREYRSYFNAFAISVASTNSGSDHPSQGVFKNTYFNSSYDSYGRPELITIPPNDRDTNYDNGEGKVFSLLTSLMPEYDLVILVVNDLHYGGSGGPVLISSVHVDAPEIVAHESGHAFAGLTDEYDDPLPGSIPVEKPNATAQTSRARIAWNSWILPSTPLPTPEDSTNAFIVGLFQGAQYQSRGWYRPKLDCKMRTLGIDFCEVCSEALVKAMYTAIRPIDSFSPSSTNLTVLPSAPVSFSVTPLEPASHRLDVQWFTNSVAVTGATNTTFEWLPGSVGNGAHTVRAVVHDPTALVRSDPAKLLHATNTWSVSVSINQLSLQDALFLADGRFRLTATGAAPRGLVIEASTNLVNWVPISTNNLVGGRFDYTNSGQTSIPYRFYRAFSPP
jgi:hypothetical protein